MARPSRRRISYRNYAYNRITPEYRDRLRHQGIGRSEYVQGYNLQNPPPLTRARREGALERVASGRERPEDLGIVRRWYSSRYIPAGLRNQPGVNKVATAAALSQIPDWTKVTNFSFEPTKEPVWRATVTMTDGTTREVWVPGYVVEDMRAWLAESDIENDIGGTP